MVYVGKCIACKNGNHKNCHGGDPPKEAPDGQELIGGTFACSCDCGYGDYPGDDSENEQEEG